MSEPTKDAWTLSPEDRDLLIRENATWKDQRRFEAAKAAMQGLLALEGLVPGPTTTAQLAVTYADNLLTELAKRGEGL